MHGDEPLLVFGPRSITYDFGPSHPLTPRRFGPGISLLRSLGAAPAIEPEPADDDDLLAVHSAAYLDAVRRLSRDPAGPPDAGIGRGGDNPAFEGMHEAAAAVADGSIRAMDAILRGEALHAFHPGGGLHHAMRDRASGFCIYNDPALAIARARSNGLRVLYVDLDVHHGDGVQELHRADPGVLTISFHESGRYLFPGTGSADDVGEGEAAGTVVNVPFEPASGENAWLPAVTALVPELAAAFGPDLIVSQHGADSHAWDPLAHLLVTTTAMGAAARLVDRVAHRRSGGRWLATGGGGYDAYRVVPRTWSHVWLAAAHREVPATIPAAWREQWAAEAERFGQAPLPAAFDDAPNAGLPRNELQLAAERRSGETVGLVRSMVVPAIIRCAVDRSWWDPLGEGDGRGPDLPPESPEPGVGTVAVQRLEIETMDRVTLAPRILPIADGQALAVIRRAIEAGGRAAAAIRGSIVVGIAVVVAEGGSGRGSDRLAALGVAPGFRRRGLARALLAEVTAAQAPGRPLEAVVTVAERDWLEPLPGSERRRIATRLLEGAGFSVRDADGALGRADRLAIRAVRG